MGQSGWRCAHRRGCPRLRARSANPTHDAAVQVPAAADPRDHHRRRRISRTLVRAAQLLGSGAQLRGLAWFLAALGGMGSGAHVCVAMAYGASRARGGVRASTERLSGAEAVGEDGVVAWAASVVSAGAVLRDAMAVLEVRSGSAACFSGHL